MDSAVIQLLVLAGIAVFLILKLRSVLGTRDGYERPPEPAPGPASPAPRANRGFEVIEGGEDRDITDHVPANSDAATALAAMKRAEPSFNVSEFLGGARGAYEMILMGFENGQLDDLVPFLSRDVFESFDEVVQHREREGLTVEASFVGLREIEVAAARFDPTTREAEITIRFTGEITSVVRDRNGTVVEGDPNRIKQERDSWTFARKMGSDNPNWRLVATGD
ncbi:Tim44/TimA family putative adaptor protein [Pararhodobacter sp. CCB-MM2]|uniref:Tim44/TimA family putative adaptor protein n=1 Tax=Pararhodobacter sp. CCB-MM2 TaxID=1786003 RepID=UPI00082BAE9C|nr:Tim44/TimA family putative adaptor protein [Pararhodobacter sp. CCB-MM2]